MKLVYRIITDPFTVATIVLVALKLCGEIDWGWLAVLSPVLVAWVIMAILSTIYGFIVFAKEENNA